MNSDSILLPGFMDEPELYKPFETINLWAGEDPLPKLASASIAIGHSLGANWLVAHAHEFSAQLILVNPIIPSPGFLGLIPDWLKYVAAEGLGLDHSINLKHFPYSLSLARVLLNRDSLQDLQQISPNRVTIIRGLNDTFMFSTNRMNTVTQHGFSVNTMPDCKHNWNNSFAVTLEKIIVGSQTNPQDSFDNSNPSTL